jgi:anti-sigma factor RsiW
MENQASVVVLQEVLADHFSADALEQYLLRALPAAEMARIAEHTLACEECGARLSETGEFISAIRAALRMLKSGTI